MFSKMVLNYAFFFKLKKNVTILIDFIIIYKPIYIWSKYIHVFYPQRTFSSVIKASILSFTWNWKLQIV